MHGRDTTVSPAAGAAFGPVRRWLRLEGLLVLAVAALLYARTGSGWTLFAVTFLAPDLALAAYLAGPRLGAAVYNAGHSYVGPLALGLAALSSAAAGVAPRALVTAACVWAAHIGFDRLLGYGLKYPTEFGDTHLGYGLKYPTEFGDTHLGRLGRARPRPGNAGPLRTAARGVSSAG